jgi:hypothetical protein
MVSSFLYIALDIEQKRSIKRTLFFSLIGANIYTQHHHHHHQHPNQVSSAIKPTQTTSDYYSNSSKHEEG